MIRFSRPFAIFALLALTSVVAAAQQPKPAVPLTAGARLTAAKTAFLKSGGGNEIPFNVISSAFESWGRFTLTDSPEKADIIVEVSSPSDNSGVTVSSSTSTSPLTGKSEQSTSTSRNLSVSEIKLVVYDGRTKMPVWSATDKPKFAIKQNARENNLVQAAQRLFYKFHDRMEPSQPQ